MMDLDAIGRQQVVGQWQSILTAVFRVLGIRLSRDLCAGWLERDQWQMTFKSGIISSEQASSGGQEQQVH